jgi:hypothetical protein
LNNTLTLHYGGSQFELADSQENKDIFKSAARGHDSFLEFELANGGTLAVLAGPGIPFAVTYTGASKVSLGVANQRGNSVYDR